ncbi:hypothetical protein AgCh_016180 [Apium graveolens]
MLRRDPRRTNRKPDRKSRNMENAQNITIRHVTLIGFSLGARVIFKCLETLAKADCDAQLVERVFLLGSPLSIKGENWEEAMKVVSGRFVNAYSTNDWMLGVVFRASLLSKGLAEMQEVDTPGIENANRCNRIRGGSLFIPLDYSTNYGKDHRLRSSLWLQFKPHQIAAGAAYLATKSMNMDLTSSQHVWQEFQTPSSVLKVIGRTEAVTIRVAGVLKDWILIALSTVIFPESIITGLNITCYAIECKIAKDELTESLKKEEILKKRLEREQEVIKAWKSSRDVHAQITKVQGIESFCNASWEKSKEKLKSNLVEGLLTDVDSMDDESHPSDNQKGYPSSDINPHPLAVSKPSKDESSEIIINHIRQVNNHPDFKVRRIRSDNGTEFKNSVMRVFCEENGIMQEFSATRTPQQNGVVERKNRSLIVKEMCPKSNHGHTINENDLMVEELINNGGVEKLEYVLDSPKPTEPANDAHNDEHVVYRKWIDDANVAQCIMLASMNIELQKQHEHMDAHTILMHLQELYDMAGRTT